MTENHFAGRIARSYDSLWPELAAPEVVDPAVAFLAELAAEGAALELGIGTGRLALPLSERGVPVHGIELSPPMVDELQAKPGADRVGVTIGDFSTTRVDGTFSVAYVVRNTIMNLTTLNAQLACFENVAAHLEPGGCFVIEVMVPTLRRVPPGEQFLAFSVTPTHLGFDEFTDFVAQTSVSHHYFVHDGEAMYFAAPFRYVWPSELDLMARVAGMRLRERWADWHRTPFTGDSPEHVSVWEKL